MAVESIAPLPADTVSFREPFLQAHRRVVAAAAAQGPDFRLATTLTVLTVQPERGLCRIASCGDSRVAIVRGNVARWLTSDGRPGTDHAPSRFLSSAIGGEHDPLIEEFDVLLADGDRLLVCSDGVYQKVDLRVIASIVQRGGVDAAARAVVDEAVAAGTTDDATIVVIDVARRAPLRVPAAGDPPDLLVAPTSHPN